MTTAEQWNVIYDEVQKYYIQFTETSDQNRKNLVIDNTRNFVTNGSKELYNLFISDKDQATKQRIDSSDIYWKDEFLNYSKELLEKLEQKISPDKKV
ncbi:hypothetical protein ACHRV5_00345 [Flavobacterium sp. FlaQc-52]|jgi:hypothetical protein|uniref:hypothetical protein n=1 Tax=Flavobacterium sp. FlaQc-52 TaxID=3374185 RepID=UPI003757A1A0